MVLDQSEKEINRLDELQEKASLLEKRIQKIESLLTDGSMDSGKKRVIQKDLLVVQRRRQKIIDEISELEGNDSEATDELVIPS